MRFSHRVAIIFSLGIVFSGFVRADSAAPPFAPGSKLESLVVGAVTYQNVEIRSVNARSLFITHAKGMASIRLRDLTPELQARFAYDPAKDGDPAAPTNRPPPQRASAPLTTSAPSSAMNSPLLQFGQPAAIQANVDLRRRMFELKLGVKNQGRRPSCSIFAVVSALEFQNADRKGEPEKFSEEYLTWATRKITRRPASGDCATAPDEDADEGFSLGEVVAALRAYGIPPQSSMPNTLGRSLAQIDEPPAAVIAAAQTHERVFVYTLPGHDNFTRLNNAVHVLNTGRPVVIGLGWPSYRTLRMAYLADQMPLSGRSHAVTLVGYSSDTGRIEDAIFVFKNSWGANWGHGGYGTVTFSYLNKYLQDTLVLELPR